MLSVIYVECHKKLVMLNALMPSTIMLNVIALIVIMLNVIMLNVIMLNVIMLNVIMLNVIMLSVITLSVIMLSIIMLSVIILSLVVPYKGPLLRMTIRTQFFATSERLITLKKVGSIKALYLKVIMIDNEHEKCVKHIIEPP